MQGFALTKSRVLRAPPRATYAAPIRVAARDVHRLP